MSKEFVTMHPASLQSHFRSEFQAKDGMGKSPIPINSIAFASSHLRINLQSKGCIHTYGMAHGGEKPTQVKMK